MVFKEHKKDPEWAEEDAKAEGASSSMWRQSPHSTEELARHRDPVLSSDTRFNNYSVESSHWAMEDE